MSCFYAGIDPGKTGAIAILRDDLEIVKIHDFVDPATAHRFLWDFETEHGQINMAVLEKVHAMPKQGVKSVWSFAENYGSWHGILTAMCIPYVAVPPQTWMKGVITKADHKDVKKRGLTVCRRRFPQSRWFRREKDHNRADATLIAMYCMMRERGTLL